MPDDALQDVLKGLDAEDITRPGGLLTQLAGRVIETALGGELTEHLGYPLGQAPPGGAGTSRNGSMPKTAKTELGPVQINAPRDRQGSFDPKLVAERQTRLAGLDDRILALYAGGMTVRDIEAHLQASTASESAATPSVRSPTRCLRMSPPGALDRWTPSFRSSTSTA